MPRRSAILSTVLSFAAGILLGYFAQIYYAKRGRRKRSAADTEDTEFDRMYEVLDGIERQLDQIRLRLDQGGGQVHEHEEAAEVDGTARQVTSCQSSEDVFYDTNDSLADNVQVTVSNGICADKQLLFDEVDREFEDGSSDRQFIYEKLKRHIATLSAEANFWWRLAKAAHFLSKTDFYVNTENKEAKKILLYESFEFSQRALKLDDTNGDCHKWYAITIGTLSDYVSTKEKISNGIKFKSHLDKAMSLKSDDPTLFHLAGRFCVELVALSWIELKVANTFLGPIPTVTHQDALDYFLAAHKLKPTWKENILFIAQQLLAMKQFAEANKFVQEGLALPVNGEEESAIQVKLQEIERQCLA